MVWRKTICRISTNHSKVLALNKCGRCKKFDPKGFEYVIVGYSQESKAYRLWRRNTNTVIKARDVKFFEIVSEEPQAIFL